MSEFGDFLTEWPSLGRFIEGIDGARIETKFDQDTLPTWEDIIRSTYEASHKAEVAKYNSTEKSGWVFLTHFITLKEFKSKFSKSFTDYVLDSGEIELVCETIVFVPEWDMVIPFADLKIIYGFITDYRDKKITSQKDLKKRIPAFKEECLKCLNYSWAYHGVSRGSDMDKIIPTAGRKCLVEFTDPNFVSYGKFKKNL